MSRPWSNKFCGCFNDCTTCIIAWFCPCYVFGKNAEAVGDSCLLCALSQFVPIVNLWARVSVRGKIRELKGIEGSCFNDFLSHCACCAICALVQEAQEVKEPQGQSIARE